MVARGSSLLVCHAGTGAGVVELEQSVVHEKTDARVQDRLRHRPRQQWRCRGDGFGRAVEVRERAAVPFEQEASPVDHHGGVRGAVAVGVADQLVDELVELGGRAAERPAIRVGGGPGHIRSEQLFAQL